MVDTYSTFKAGILLLIIWKWVLSSVQSKAPIESVVMARYTSFTKPSYFASVSYWFGRAAEPAAVRLRRCRVLGGGESSVSGERNGTGP